MRPPSVGAAVLCDVLLLPLLYMSRLGTAAAQTEPSPLWIQPSGEWYGIDGTWSSFTFAVGSPAQIVYLTVATALSEIWVVSSHGCSPVQLCIDARGGVFNAAESETWRSLGHWQLGMNYTGMGGIGDYGLETLAFVNTVTRFTTAIDGALIAAINDTNYYQGYVGVGVTHGRFGHNVTYPFISQLVELYGTIPSHSYGYTAGAYYRENGKNRGTIASLTLGGYDTLRFVSHDTKFSLDPVSRLPTVRLRGVTAQVSSMDDAPTSNWTSTSNILVNMDDSIIAVVDSSTPYLWLPTEVCERFAAALNLTWRDDLGVYVFSDVSQYGRYQSDKSLSFTFTLSSYHNADNFGEPFNTPGVVNITLPSAAFAQLLRYPFRNVIQWGESSIPYFPLKRSTEHVNDNRYIIGRVFMQEAYIITSYDRGTFSLHQALFPDNASTNYSLEAITRPPDSPFPRFKGEPAPGDGLNVGQTVAIVLSAFITGSILGLVAWLCCRRKRRTRQKETAGQDENKDGPQPVAEETPTKSPVRRMFSIFLKRKGSKRPAEPRGADGDRSEPVEVGADAQHQVYEMPVPPEPVELDSHDVGDEDTDFGIDSTQGLSQYEITRRKLDRQLQGPVPSYTPTASAAPVPGQEKSMQDPSPVAHYRPSEEPSPASSPTYTNSISMPVSLPSPLTPHGDWTGRPFDLPSPMTLAPPERARASSHQSEPGGSSPVSPRSMNLPQAHSPSTAAPSGSNPSPTNPSPTSPFGSMPLPSPSFQRTPIDPSRVICLGPLPENVQLPIPRLPIPRIAPPDNPSAARGAGEPRPGELPLPQQPAPGHARTPTQDSTDTLGSNYTVEEERRLRAAAEEMARQLHLHQHLHQQRQGVEHEGGRHEREGQGKGGNGGGSADTNDSDDMPCSPCSLERIETGAELVHVPQVPERRYSWEDEGRDTGTC